MPYPKGSFYRRAARGALGIVALGSLAFASTLAVLAQATPFDGGGQIGGDDYTYDSGPYAIVYDGTLYEYATGTDGKGYYTTYDGEEWSSWQGWDDQPADYQWQPTAVDFNDSQYVFYNGQDGGIYHNAYDGEEWSGWENLAGDYSFDYAPYANTYGDAVYLYGVADDGYLYYKAWQDAEWSDWAAVSEEYTAGGYQPYGVDWDDYNNVFWTGDDGKVYWNRYDGSEWTGAKALPYEADEYQYDSAPYAIGYSEDEKLYAYAVTADGAPNWNVFDGEGWSGWKEYEAEFPAKAKYQPNAYEYDGKQHLMVTGDDGHAYYTTYDGEYGEWQDLGDNYDYDPYQYEYNDGYYLTYTGTTGYIYYKVYGGDGGDGGYEAEPTEDDGY